MLQGWAQGDMDVLDTDDNFEVKISDLFQSWKTVTGVEGRSLVVCGEVQMI